MTTLMYVHGYGSSSQALKCKTLQQMFPDCEVVAPDFDYTTIAPDEVQATLRRMVEQHDVRLIVGSSFGGYHTLCATAFFEGPVWCINPVHHVVETIQQVLQPTPDQHSLDMMQSYKEFDQRVFQRLPHRPMQVNFALSTDDEVLGNHQPLLTLFPNAGRVVWRDNATHHFKPFGELKDDIAASLREALQNR